MSDTHKIRIRIIGVDEGGRNSLPPETVEAIEKSPILAGGQRQLALFPDHKGRRLVIKNKLSELVEILQKENRDAVVLASGDPLFFGIGSYLLTRFSPEKYDVEIRPAVSSMQFAFAKAGLSWQDCRSISLHGRKLEGLAQRLYPEKKIAILTDETNHPGKIAAYMLHYNLVDYHAYVAESLGMPGEKGSWHTLEDLAQKESQDFSDLNVLILVRDEKAAATNFSFGINDGEFSFPEKPDGLITKKEIRTLSLAAMNLGPGSVVWDIGSCTASVSIEAAHIARDGRVYAIEKNPEHARHARLNCKKFHADISLVEAEAPEGLVEWADPDAVFIGGSGGNLEQILEVCARRLRPRGRIVVNAATLETLTTAIGFLEKSGFVTETCLVQISRSRAIGDLTRFAALNPVFILTACRDNDA